MQIPVEGSDQQIGSTATIPWATDFRASEYFGPPLNDTSRLIRSAHGGQVPRRKPFHDVLLHQVVSGNFGFVFKTIGDTFCCAFQCASDALQAAIDAQLAFRAGYWPEIVSFKVRMAIHTGLADIMGNDYFGPPLNCTSRLLKAGHGGQILLSGETCEASVNIFPKSSSIKLLGTHALRDLRRPVTIFQLCYPGLQYGFPELRLDNPPAGASGPGIVAA